jgi:Tfp pilus assembly protein PilO
MASSFKRFISILGSIAVLIAAVIVFTNFIRPEFEGATGVKQLRIKRDAAAATLSLATAQVDAFANLAKQYEDSFQYKADLDKSLPAGDNIPEVLVQIQGLASADKIGLANITFQHPPMQSGAGALTSAYGVLRASLRGEGAYNDIKTFIQDIENNVRLMDIATMNISASGRTNIYSLQLTINTYYE